MLYYISLSINCMCSFISHLYKIFSVYEGNGFMVMIHCELDISEEAEMALQWDQLDSIFWTAEPLQVKEKSWDHPFVLQIAVPCESTVGTEVSAVGSWKKTLRV